MPDSTVTTAVPVMRSADLQNIASFDDALAFATDTFGAIVDSADVLGDGFSRVDKAQLIHKTFIVLGWTFAKDKATEQDFVVVRIVTRGNKKLFFTDGSTGIFAQLTQLSNERGIYGGLLVSDGLRVSEYTVTDDKGKESAASTYYLSTDRSVD